ncbi:MAG: DsbA family protein [Lapillicoccus sp.]
MSLIVYGDFTCPACYLASWRADLLDDGPDRVDWRAVEHHPLLPLKGQRGGPQNREQSVRWQAMSVLVSPEEDLPGRVSALLASTQAAVAGYAEAYRSGVAERVRRLLFQAYWVDGLDIGDPEVLRVLLGETIRGGRSDSRPVQEWGYAVSPARGPVSSGAYRLIKSWRSQRFDLGEQPCPLLIGVGSSPMNGREAMAELGRRVADRVSEPHQLPPLSERRSSERFWY